MASPGFPPQLKPALERGLRSLARVDGPNGSSVFFMVTPSGAITIVQAFAGNNGFTVYNEARGNDVESAISAALDNPPR